MRTMITIFMIALLSSLLVACSLIPEPTPGSPATVATPLPSFASPNPEEEPAPEPTTSLPSLNQEPEATSIVALPYTVVEATVEPLQDTPTPIPTYVETFPDPGAYQWRQVASGLQRPVGLVSAFDGTGRLFALEQDGVIRIVQNGEVLADPFLDITGRVGSSASEQGLLGLAFHPNYAENGYFYVNYTDLNGDTSISRFRVSADPNTADPSTESVLMQISQPFGNHNGGVVTFGPDGYLYLGLGDGGSGGDPMNNGQSLNTLLGKILRIDVDGGEPYAAPPDNPIVESSGRPEIWAYGLRNPWRISFDRLTGDLYIADVGQNSFEEVNFQPVSSPGGENYGWNIMEAFACYNAASCDQTGLVPPVTAYATRQQGNCSVTGGYVYRGSLEQWQGVYLYGDYCSGLVWGLLPRPNGEWQQTQLFETGASITSFGQDQAGEVYLVDHSGNVLRLESR